MRWLRKSGSMLLSSVALCLAAAASPGWAQTIGASASHNIVLTSPGGASQLPAAKPAAAAAPSGIKPAAVSSGASPAIPPEVQELARALKYNPQLIYEYVYDNIRILPRWGSIKGPLGAILDGNGTVFDSAELLLQLLQISATHNGAITNPQFVVGTNTLTGTQLSNWLNMSSASSMMTLLSSGNFQTVTFTTSGDTVTSGTIGWAWVTVQVNGTTLTLDPSTKSYQTWPGFGSDASSTFATNSGYNYSSFYSDATYGSNNTGYEVSALPQGWGKATTDLTSYTNKFSNYLKANPSITATQAIGGSDVIPLPAQAPIPQTPQGSLTAQASYPYVYDGYRTIVSVQILGGQLESWNSSDLYGHRLTLSFDASGTPRVTLGYANSAIGTVAGTGAAAYTVLYQGTQALGASASGYVSFGAAPSSASPSQVTSPTSLPPSCSSCLHYATVQFTTGYNISGGTYLPSVYSFILGEGDAGRAQAEKHRTQLAGINLVNPNQPTSEPTLGESLAVIGDQWLAEKAQAQKVLSGASGTETIVQGEIGLVGIRAFNGTLGPYLDIPTEDVSVVQRTQRSTGGEPTPLETGVFATDNLLGSRIESGVIEQTQPNTSDVSTTFLFAAEAEQGGILYDAGDPQVPNDTCSFYVSSIRPQLTPTYQQSDLTIMDEEIGYNPTNGTCGSTSGSGRILVTKNGGNLGAFLALQTRGTYIQSFIAGGYSGGDSTTALTAAQVGANAQITVYPDSQTPIAASVGGLPGGVSNGDSFTYNHTDLSTGSGSFPYALSFTRSYDSSQRLVVSSLGNGWSSNLSITALQGSDPFEGLGSNSALSASSAIAILSAAKDVLTPPSGDVEPTAIQVEVGAELVDYIIGPLRNNVVTVTRPGNVEHFVRQSGATAYAPPLGSADSVALNSDQSVNYQAKGGVSLSFDTAGNIKTWSSTKGPTVTVTYNNPGVAGEVPTEISNNMGRSLSFVYNGSPSELYQVSDGNGRKVTYGYATTGDLTTVLDPTSATTTYTYDSLNHLTQVSTPAAGGKTSTSSVAYDTLDRIETVSDALSRTTSYFLAGTRSEVDDPLGDAIVDYFDTRKLERATFDAVGNESQYSYNTQYELTQVTRPEQNTTQYQYDTRANIIQVTDTPKPSATNYHPQGGLLATRSRSFTYDPTYDELLNSTDYAGNITTYALNTNGTLASVTLPAPGSGAAAPAYSYTYDSYGKPTAVTKPDGTITTMTYDAQEDITSVIVDSGSSPAHLQLTTTYTYDGIGNVLSIIDPKRNATSYAYDVLRRRTQTTLPADAQGNAYTTTVGYDPNGQVASVVQPVAYAGGTAAQNLLTRTTTYTYDLAGELTSTLDPTGDTTSYAYDAAGRQTQVTQGVYIKATAYDADGRPTTVSAGTSGNLQPIANYATYNPNGTLGSFCYWKDSTCIPTFFTPDGFDRPATTTYPDGTTETHAYTYDNYPDYFRNRAGQTITASYDALHRRIQKNGDPTVSYTYDSLGRRLSAALANGAGTWTYTYDGAGRVLTTVQPGAGSIAYGWDASGNMTSMQVTADVAAGSVVGGGTEFVTYDALNRPVTFSGMANVQSSATTFWSEQYDALGRIQVRQYNEAPYATSLSSTWSYDNNGIGDDISQIVHNLGSNTATLNYTYDNSHRVTSFDTLLNGGENTLRPTAASSTTATYDASNRPLLPPCPAMTTGCFDANGNLTADGARTFTYDQEGDGRILSATDGSTTASYAYDPDGRRISKTVNGTTTTYLLNAAGQEVVELSGGEIQHFYLHSAVDTAPVVAVDGAGNMTFYHMDRTGSVVGTTSMDNVTGEYGYTPYGVATGGLSGTAFGFAGYRWDAETGLYHTQTRSYDPVMARFIQTDPSGYAGGRNLYAYTSGDPLNNVDPTGLYQSCSDADECLSVPGFGGGGGYDGPAYGAGTGLASGVSVAHGGGSSSSSEAAPPAKPTAQQQLDGPEPDPTQIQPPVGPAPTPGQDAIQPISIPAMVGFIIPIEGFAEASAVELTSLVTEEISNVSMAIEGTSAGGATGAAEALVGGAQNAVASPALASQLAIESATSAFAADGTLTDAAIAGSREIIPGSQLGNPNLPPDVSKYSTQTFQSPSGDFQVHFYMDPLANSPFYDLDYKAVFNSQGVGR